MPTAAELAHISGNPYASYLLDAVRADAPIFSALYSLPMMGTSFLTLAITALPTPSGVLDINQGYKGSKATLSMEKVEAKRFGLLVEAPVSSTDLWNAQNRLASGANIGMDYMTMQARAALRSELNNIDKLILLGTGLDSKSFFGLKEITVATTANTLALTGAPEADKYVRSAINAGGTTSATASSVYSICEGEEDLALRIGGIGGIEGFLGMSPVKTVFQADPGDATRKQEYYISTGEGYMGLSIFGSGENATNRKFPQYSVRRLFNLTEDSGKTLTQQKMDFLMESHPTGHKPTKFLMSPRSQRQLRDDLASTATVFIQGSTAANSTYTRKPELPPDYRGIPIIVSEEIGSTDAIETPA